MIWIFGVGVFVYSLGFFVLASWIQSDWVVVCILLGTLLMIGPFISSLYKYAAFRMEPPEGLVRKQAIMISSLFLVAAVVLFYALADGIMAM
ncbi:hypothetical protein KKG46_00155 [Patescibacteria group bacterium]|nr:hypothetical protein [Patescibacteria group bacterium]